MCHCGNTGVKRTPNKSQHTKFTFEKKILPPLLPGLELATFRSRVRRSYQQAMPEYSFACFACCQVIYFAIFWFILLHFFHNSLKINSDMFRGQRIRFLIVIWCSLFRLVWPIAMDLALYILWTTKVSIPILRSRIHLGLSRDGILLGYKRIFPETKSYSASDKIRFCVGGKKSSEKKMPSTLSSCS